MDLMAWHCSRNGFGPAPSLRVPQIQALQPNAPFPPRSLLLLPGLSPHTGPHHCHTLLLPPTGLPHYSSPDDAAPLGKPSSAGTALWRVRPRAIPAATIPGNFFFFFFFCAFFFRATPKAYGSLARGRIGAVAAGLCQSHSNARSEPCP